MPNFPDFYREISISFSHFERISSLIAVLLENELTFLVNMFSKEVIVRCESGLHNRQATYFVQKANEFACNIYLESENRKMNAKSLLGIMSLGIVTGATVTLSADGADAEAAVNALEALLQRDVY